jgi:TolA-binding protein
LRDQIATRDNEVARLGSLLEMERGQNTGYRRNTKEGDHSQEEDDLLGSSQFVKMSRVEQLEMQVDYLNETISDMEKVYSERGEIFDVLLLFVASCLT